MSNKRKAMAESKNIKLNNHVALAKDKESNGFFSRHRKSSLLMIGGATVLIIAILSVGFAFSWFAPRTEADITVKVTDFSARTMISFDGEAFEELKDTHNVNVGADGDIGDLKLNIEYEGKSSAYIRVQLFESFKQENGGLYPTVPVTYALVTDSKWVYRDGYYYYTEPLHVEPTEAAAESGEDGEEVKEYISIPFIDGASCDYNTESYNGVYFNLVSVIEEVQPDRFEEFFGLDTDTAFGTDNQ